MKLFSLKRHVGLQHCITSAVSSTDVGDATSAQVNSSDVLFVSQQPEVGLHIIMWQHILDRYRTLERDVGPLMLISQAKQLPAIVTGVFSIGPILKHVRIPPKRSIRPRCSFLVCAEQQKPLVRYL